LRGGGRLGGKLTKIWQGGEKEPPSIQKKKKKMECVHQSPKEKGRYRIRETVLGRRRIVGRSKTPEELTTSLNS